MIRINVMTTRATRDGAGGSKEMIWRAIADNGSMTFTCDDTDQHKAVAAAMRSMADFYASKWMEGRA